jgi:uncharacterized protein YjbI with pentapeptide repeats
MAAAAAEAPTEEAAQMAAFSAVVLFLVVASSPSQAIDLAYSLKNSRCEDSSGETKPLQRSVNLRECSSFFGRNFFGSRWKDLNLSGSTFRLTTLKDVSAENIKWHGSDLGISNWDFNNFKNVQAERLKLVGATFNRTTWINFFLRGSDWRGSKINRSRFFGGDLTDAKFNDAMITDTLFEDVILPKNFHSVTTLINVKIVRCRYL